MGVTGCWEGHAGALHASSGQLGSLPCPALLLSCVFSFGEGELISLFLPSPSSFLNACSVMVCLPSKCFPSFLLLRREPSQPSLPPCRFLLLLLLLLTLFSSHMGFPLSFSVIIIHMEGASCLPASSSSPPPPPVHVPPSSSSPPPPLPLHSSLLLLLMSNPGMFSPLSEAGVSVCFRLCLSSASPAVTSQGTGGQAFLHVFMMRAAFFFFSPSGGECLQMLYRARHVCHASPKTIMDEVRMSGVIIVQAL